MSERIVNGRWRWDNENDCWVCENCELSALNNYRGYSTASDYCPHCGAPMLNPSIMPNRETESVE